MSTKAAGTARHDRNVGDVAAASEVSRLLAEDKTPWHQKRNLRRLYGLLVPAGLGVEITTGKYLSLYHRIGIGVNTCD